MIRNYMMLLVLTAALPAGATTMRALSVDELSAGAERIVVGTVLTREGRWAGRRIFTHNRIRVDQVWHGPRSDRLTLLTAGGRVGDLGQKVDGAVQLRVGQRVVLFLVAGESGVYHPLGMAQGVFHVDGDDPLAPIDRHLGGVRIVDELPVLPDTLSGLRQAVQEVRHVP